MCVVCTVRRRGWLLFGVAFFGSCEEFPNDDTTAPRYREHTHPESAGGMNLTFGVEILQKRDLQFIYTPKKAEFADLFPFMVCK